VIAVLAVISAVPKGLLAHPDMRIAAGADNGEFAWFIDQTSAQLAHTGVLSVSLWWYKIEMLTWALWLSFALTGWIKWVWQVFSRDGLWRNETSAPPPMPSGPAPDPE
jgi:hypothetical protein